MEWRKSEQLPEFEEREGERERSRDLSLIFHFVFLLLLLSLRFSFAYFFDVFCIALYSCVTLVAAISRIRNRCASAAGSFYVFMFLICLC